MQPYKFQVKYLPEQQNMADPLSGLLQTDKQEDSSSAHKFSDEFVKFIAVTATPRSMTTHEIKSSLNCFAALRIECGKLTNINSTFHTSTYHTYQCIPANSELCVIGKLILRGTRITAPSKLRAQVLILAQEGHPGIISIKQRLWSKVWWSGIDNEVERFCKTCHGCQLVTQSLSSLSNHCQ